MGRAGSLPLAEFFQRRAEDRWLARLTHDVPFPSARGLEFGAARTPTPLPDGHRVEYVDYSDRPHGYDESWVKVDYAWAGIGSLAAVCGVGQTYDFAIARNVAHFVPNLLGWFSSIADVLKTGGVFNISLPDHRFTADCARRPSTIAEAVEALMLNFSRPSPRQLFDHTYNLRTIESGRRWREDLSPAQIPRVNGGDA